MVSMYTATVDGLALYNPAAGYHLESPKVTQELNKVGSFDFTIRPGHPAYDHIHKLSSVVTVRDRQQIIFRGRVLSSEEGFRGELDVTCESDLAYLLDSIVRPYDYSGTLQGYLQKLIDDHNSQVDEYKQLTVGNVTVTDANDYIHYSSTQYPSTWDEISDKLIKTHGGYITLRYGEDATYIDYLDDFTLLSNQAVKFGSNLLDFARKIKGDDVITALIPLGAKDDETDTRLTIAGVNGGTDYVYDEDAVEAYGWIFDTQEWDDVTEAQNLLTKANQSLAQRILLGTELEISAVDLAALDSSIGSFHVGTYVKVDSPPHGVSANFLVSKISIDLNEPDGNKLNLGAVGSTFTDIVQGNKGDVEQVVNDIVSDATVELDKMMTSAIQQATDSIMTQVSESYYLKDDATQIIQQFTTQLTQTKDEFLFQFNQFSQSLEDLQEDMDANFVDISRYIRFVNGNIILGEVGNELILEIEHDRISFQQSGVEVAYFSNNKLYITDAEVLNRLDLGNFAYFPRNNGNLTMRYIG